MTRKIATYQPKEPGPRKLAPRKKKAAAAAAPKQRKAPMVPYSQPLVRNILTDFLALQSKGVQLSLFETLTPEALETLKRELSTGEDGVKDWINKKGEGLQLDVAEGHLLHCLQTVLKEQSVQSYDVKKPGFYMGKSQDRIICTYDGVEIVHECAQVEVTKYELAKMYSDGKAPSGATEQRIEEMLERFDSDRHSYPLRYIARAQPDGKGGITVKEVTRYERLLRVAKSKEVLVESEGGKVVRRSQGYIITFHPLFSQFARGFITLREDTHRKLKAKQGADWKLHLFIAEQYGHNKRQEDWTASGNEEELFRLLFPKDFEAKKRSKMEGNFLKAVEACKRTGLVLSAERRTGARGQAVWRFELNSEYEYDEDAA